MVPIVSVVLSIFGQPYGNTTGPIVSVVLPVFGQQHRAIFGIFCSCNLIGPQCEQYGNTTVPIVNVVLPIFGQYYGLCLPAHIVRLDHPYCGGAFVWSTSRVMAAACSPPNLENVIKKIPAVSSLAERSKR